MANYLNSSLQMAISVNLSTSLSFLSSYLFAGEKRLKA